MGILNRIHSAADLAREYPALCEELVKSAADLAVVGERQRIEALRPKDTLALKAEFPQLCEEITAEAKEQGEVSGFVAGLHRIRTILTKSAERGIVSLDAEAMTILLDASKPVSDALLALNDLHKERRGRRLASFIEDAPEPVNNAPEGQEISLWDQALAQAVADHNASVEQSRTNTQ